MRDRSLLQSTRQLFLLLAGFAVAGVLLESDGLANWANGLDVGPLRTVAVPATQAVQRTLQPLGLGALRQGTLANLARVGWSDDSALTAKVAASATNAPASSTPLPAACPTAPASAHNASTHAAPALGAETPIVDYVPHTVGLPDLPPVESGKPRVVALVGDSMMAVGLSAQLQREAAGHKNVRVVRAFRSGTGLARPEVFNWMDEYPAMIGAEKPDVVLVAIGANDGQGFVVDRKVLACGSDEWRKVYQQRVADFLALLEDNGARVVWVGLPPMRIPAYQDKMAMINRIDYTVVSQHPQATWWNPVEYIGDATGGFREFAKLGQGKTMRVRATDGIHLSDEGAGLVTPMLVKWLDPPPPTPPASATADEQPTGGAEAAASSARGRGATRRRLGTLGALPKAELGQAAGFEAGQLHSGGTVPAEQLRGGLGVAAGIQLTKQGGPGQAAGAEVEDEVDQGVELALGERDADEPLD